MHDKPVALVTGANRGLGLQIAKDMTAIAYPCEEVGKGLVEAIPLGRIGFPEDVAGLVAFLASSEAKWITGEIIKVSGGAR